MKIEGSLPCSKEPATDPCSEPHASSHYLPTHSNIILSSTPSSSLQVFLPNGKRPLGRSRRSRECERRGNSLMHKLIAMHATAINSITLLKGNKHTPVLIRLLQYIKLYLYNLF